MNVEVKAAYQSNLRSEREKGEQEIGRACVQ